MTRTRFHALIEQRLIQLDGATGTELVKRGMPAGVCPESVGSGAPGSAGRRSAGLRRIRFRFGICADLRWKPAQACGIRSGKTHRGNQPETRGNLRRAVPGKLVFGDIAPDRPAGRTIRPLPSRKRSNCTRNRCAA
ncbi:MAG: hypothetical protein L6W00_23805 [Lentisphaeria bacterium]|nr:MAG: hypothetical protein L6W00_23805 [Lentisphaeria bacterium]